MAQLSVGASVPRIDPVAGVGALCHPEDYTGGTPSKAPSHPPDCPVCPFCIALHASFALVPVTDSPLPPAVMVAFRSELPPPATAPPAPHRPPSQPRAPPIFS
jgi:hypothetical protein